MRACIAFSIALASLALLDFLVDLALLVLSFFDFFVFLFSPSIFTFLVCICVCLYFKTVIAVYTAFDYLSIYFRFIIPDASVAMVTCRTNR